jgi:50S ribosomal protein L16 3-hydroxylase
MKKVLENLISPSPISEFFSAYENNKPMVVHGLSDSIYELTSLPMLSSLSDLLNCWPDSIQAHLPDVRDEASSIDTTPKDAQKLFDNGMGLLFNHADTKSEVLTRWLHELRSDLGLSALTNGRCMLYATPKGGGTATHFDQNINFVLQLSGTKKWRLTPNTEVINPMSRHTLGLPTDPELESYLEAPLPLSIEENSEAVELRAGSLLFVPRGCWHSTEASSDALSLNFTYTAPTWIDLFTAALRGRLAQSDAWRETARSEQAEKKLDFLLSELIEDLPHWRARDILEATES